MKRKRVMYGMLLLAGLVVCLIVIGAQDYISLAHIKTHIVQLQKWFAGHPFVGGLAISLVFFVALSLPLPITAITIMSSGYLFGFIQGLVIISIVSLASAILVFMATRFYAQEFIRTYLASYTKKLDVEMLEGGFWWALSFRLFPVIPFFALNCLKGLTTLRFRDFVASTFLGMIPVSIILVNAGSRLAEIEHVNDVLTAEIMLSLLLVALLPIVIRLTLRVMKKREINP